jgi:hypothetical protein
MSGILTTYKLMFWPGDGVPWAIYASSVLYAVLFLAAGLALFRRLEGAVLKEI